MACVKANFCLLIASIFSLSGRNADRTVLYCSLVDLVIEKTFSLLVLGSMHQIVCFLCNVGISFLANLSSPVCKSPSLFSATLAVFPELHPVENFAATWECASVQAVSSGDVSLCSRCIPVVVYSELIALALHHAWSGESLIAPALSCMHARCPSFLMIL